MAQSSLIQVRVDKDTKQQADALFTTLGMDTPTAVRLFLKQAILKHGIPFSITAPEDFYNEYNMKHLEEAAQRMETRQHVVIKTLEELEALEDE